MRRLLLIALLCLTGCAAGVSSRCGYDWNGTEICETRFHHPGKPGTFTTYAYSNGQLVPLSSKESSSIFAPLEAVGSLRP